VSHGRGGCGIRPAVLPGSWAGLCCRSRSPARQAGCWRPWTSATARGGRRTSRTRNGSKRRLSREMSFWARTGDRAEPLESQAIYMTSARVFALSNAAIAGTTMARWYLGNEGKIRRRSPRSGRSGGPRWLSRRLAFQGVASRRRRRWAKAGTPARSSPAARSNGVMGGRRLPAAMRVMVARSSSG
jgi:hypothetical protein